MRLLGGVRGACTVDMGGWVHVQGGVPRERDEGEVAGLALEQQSYFGTGDEEEEDAVQLAGT